MVVLFGCTPKGTAQSPEPEPAVAEVTDGGADATSGTTETPGTSGPGQESPADPGAEASDPPGQVDPATEPATPTAEAEPATAEPATADSGAAEPSGPSPKSEPKPVVATLELPRPVHGKVDATCGRDAGVGQSLKSFSLPGLEEGKTITNRTFRGRVQVVNFWGTWCKPCLKELPEFDQLYRRYRKHGMTLLAIATDEDAQAVKETITKKRLGAKIAIAGEDYAGQYGSPKFPFTFVVDHKGVIRGSYRGYKPECMGKLEADIREQLQVRAEARARRKKNKRS